MSEYNTEMNHRIESDHRELLNTLDELDAAFAILPEASDFINWKLEMMWKLRDFHNQLQKHFDVEEHGGYNEKLARQAPHLIPRIEHLEEDHLKITSDLNHILEVVKSIDHVQSAKIERAKCRLEDLIKFIRKHEDAENEVIQEVYFQDYGIGD